MRKIENNLRKAQKSKPFEAPCGVCNSAKSSV